MALTRALLLAAIAFSAFGQTVHFDALRNALGLTAAQVDFLQHWTPPEDPKPPLGPNGSMAAERPRFSPHGETLPAGLILTDPQRAKLEIVIKVSDRWPLADLASAYGLIDGEEWPWGPGRCHYPLSGFASELSLTPAQFEQLESLREKSTVPNADKAMAILSGSQKSELLEFEREIELAREAMELHLIPRPLRGGEVLCH